jgi:hypothetical protein
MSERTALEIADALFGRVAEWPTRDELATTLRQQHAEIERLARKNAAYASLTKAQDAELSLHRDREAAYHAAVKNIDSEREVNAILTAEREAHALEIERLKRERQHIYDLLARIHRDGGQYTAEHGVEKAWWQAEAQVATWLETISSVDELVKQEKIAESEACAVVYESLNKTLPNTLQWVVEQIRARSTT